MTKKLCLSPAQNTKFEAALYSKGLQGKGKKKNLRSRCGGAEIYTYKRTPKDSLQPRQTSDIRQKPPKFPCCTTVGQKEADRAWASGCQGLPGVRMFYSLLCAHGPTHLKQVRSVQRKDTSYVCVEGQVNLDFLTITADSSLRGGDSLQ